MPSHLSSKQNKKIRSYRFGIFAEYLAAFYLGVKGYRIVQLRYRNPKGEIDILARKQDVIVAIEVKARKNFAECVDTIPPAKQKRIAGAVQWLMLNPEKITGLRGLNAPNIRFDAVWVIPYALPRHIKDAWRM